ncbi:TPA: recombinase RecT [Citrobacter freundii]
MQNTNIITTEQTPNTISASNAVFNVQALGQLTSFAELMARSVVTVPKHLAGNPADCMAIVMQAMQWGMNPYAVAQKTHVVNGLLGYEAQLVNAVISSSSAIVGRFHYEYGGDWEKIAGKKDGRDESGLFVRVGAVLRGETDITWGEPVYLADITTRNSPLWKTAPKQQLAYLAMKYWARLYCPEVILGVYTPDELEEPREKVINPEQELLPPSVPVNESTVIDVDEWVNNLRDSIEQADTTEQTTALRQEIEAQKNALGPLYTELKGKVVKRHHRINAIARIEQMINDLPSSGEPDAAQKFAALEQALNTSRPHLGDLYDAYSTTLSDMKPEYING